MDNKIGSTLNSILFNDPLNRKDKSTSSQGTNGMEGKSDFENMLVQEKNRGTGQTEFDSGLKISAHALKRMHERQLDMDSDEFMKLREAIDKLKNKGGKDSLVITGKAAYIVDVEKNTIVTAMSKTNLTENVFTKIDSTVFVN